MDKTTSFGVITGRFIEVVANEFPRDIVRHIRQAYRLHGEGRSTNPESCFLRFPDAPDRIIALPAFLGGEYNVAGIKWVASWPANTDRGLQRASAVLVLNNPTTGYPFVCLECSLISAYRTASSAALAAEALHRRRTGIRRRTDSLGVVGAGFIGHHVVLSLLREEWRMSELRIFDLDDARARTFAERITRRADQQIERVRICKDYDGLSDDCDIIVFATVATEPWLYDVRSFRHHPVVLHLSLRDLGPEIVAGATNVVDDKQHVVRAQTSLHLAATKYGHQRFINGSLYDLIFDELDFDSDKTLLFSPFGLGVLDLALGKWIYDLAVQRQEILEIHDFFPGDVS